MTIENAMMLIGSTATLISVNILRATVYRLHFFAGNSLEAGDVTLVKAIQKRRPEG